MLYVICEPSTVIAGMLISVVVPSSFVIVSFSSVSAFAVFMI